MSCLSDSFDENNKLETEESFEDMRGAGEYEMDLYSSRHLGFTLSELQMMFPFDAFNGFNLN